MSVWLTRPQEDSAALAAILAAENIASIVAPLMDIAPRAVTLPATAPNALLLTSRHAVHALPPAWQHLPVFCVGDATAEAVRAAGYNHAIAGPGDLLSLLPMMTAQLPQGAQVLYLSGEDVAHDASALLAAHNIHVTRVVAYEATATTQLTSEMRLALEQGRVQQVVFFSARSAALACQLLKQEEFTEAAASIEAVCLSLAVAEAAAALPWRHLSVAHLPSRDALLDALRASIAR